MSNADSRIPEKIEDSVIREKYVCDGKLNCQIRCPMCPSKILPIKSAKLVEFSKKLPGKISRIIIGEIPLLANSGKLIQKLFQNFSFLDHEPGPFFWKTHPTKIYEFSISSKRVLSHIWMNFPLIRSVSRPEIVKYYFPTKWCVLDEFSSNTV